MVCRSKDEGGLGVLNLQTQNEALLIKHLSKFFNREDTPWVSLIWEAYYESGKLSGTGNKGSFWWRDVLKLLDKFKGMARVEINNGKSCLLWEDLWENEPIIHKCPELYSFVKKKNISFAESASTVPFHGLFHLPLSQQAHIQMIQLQNQMSGMQLNDLPDRWVFIWNSNIFSVNKAYKHLSGHINLHPVYSWLWNNSCQKKHKVFFWLLIKDRLSCRELLRRKNMLLQDYSCVLCISSDDESQDHLFLACPFALQCWAWINLQIDANLDAFQNLQNLKDQLHVPFFMEIIIIMCWVIWKARNDAIFRQLPPCFQRLKADFRAELQLLLLRAKRSYSPGFDPWIASLG